MTNEIEYFSYQGEKDLPRIMELLAKDLSEPYSVYTYRFFLKKWPQVTFIAKHKDTVIGVIICKVDKRKIKFTDRTPEEANKKFEETYDRGYIGMLAVDEEYRKRGIGVKLAEKSIEAMKEIGCKEVVLETEAVNKAALNLYAKLGFIRDKKLEKYYLNGFDAYRLKLSLDLS